MKSIKWVYVEDRPISRWFGSIDGIFMFEICQFKNAMFTDPYLMSSKVIPMSLKQSHDIDELKTIAENSVQEFINRISK